MRRDDDFNGYGSGTPLPSSTRRNRALSLSPEEFEQVNKDYDDCLTLSDEEMAQIGNEYKNKLTLTKQDMAQIASEHDNNNDSYYNYYKHHHIHILHIHHYEEHPMTIQILMLIVETMQQTH